MAEEFEAWLNANRAEFRADVHAELACAVAKFEAMREPNGRFVLLGLVVQDADLLDEVAAGRRAFNGEWQQDVQWTNLGPLWTYRLDHEDFTSMHFGSTDPDGGGAEWRILAEFDETAIDWGWTLRFEVGFSGLDALVWLSEDPALAVASRVLSVERSA